MSYTGANTYRIAAPRLTAKDAKKLAALGREVVVSGRDRHGFPVERRASSSDGFETACLGLARRRYRRG